MLRTLAAIVVVIAGAIAAAAYFALFVVHVNEQAIVLEFGKPVRIISEPGLYWKIPVVQTVDTFDKRILDLDTAEQEVTAVDQKRLKVDAFTRFRIVDPLLFYQAVRDERSVRSRLGPVVEFGAAPRARRLHLHGPGARQARGADEADRQAGQRGRQGVRPRGG